MILQDWPRQTGTLPPPILLVLAQAIDHLLPAVVEIRFGGGQGITPCLEESRLRITARRF